MTIPSPENTSVTVGPWSHPTLQVSVTEALRELREVKSMLASLQEREKRLKTQVDQFHAEGGLSHLVDENNSNLFHASGLSLSLCQGRKTRKWHSSVQEQIAELEAKIHQIQTIAESKRQYTDTYAPSYWRVSLSKAL